MNTTVPRYVDALRTWARVSRQGDDYVTLVTAATENLQRYFGVAVERPIAALCAYLEGYLAGCRGPSALQRAIHKSNLLYRLIYLKQALRTEACPLHKGAWAGVGDCPHGCGMCGWLPDAADPPPVVTTFSYTFRYDSPTEGKSKT